MVPVNGKPLASIQLDWLIENTDLECVAFACGHRWEKLQEYFGKQYRGVPLEYVVEENPIGTGGAIKNAITKLNMGDEDILAMNGDVLTDLPLRKMIDWHRSAGMGTMVTMLLVPYRSLYGVVRIDKLRMVRKFEEKPEFPDTWINGGIYLIQSKRIEPFLPGKGDIERDTFPKLVQNGEIGAYPYYGFWRVVDSIKDLREVEAELTASKKTPASKPKA